MKSQSTRVGSTSIRHTLATTRRMRRDSSRMDILEKLEARQLLSAEPAGSIVFVSSDVMDRNTAATAFQDAEVVFLDASRSGIDQVSQALAGRHNLDSIQFLTHGSSGRVRLGSTDLDAGTLSSLAGQVAGWGDALSDTGDILLWGCNVGAGPRGREFVKDLARITRGDIAASTNVTGSARLGGDWKLEVTMGSVAQRIVAPALLGYNGTLGVNNAPTISGADSFQSVTDIDTINPFSAVTVDDLDNDVLSISVTLDNSVKGVFTPASLSASGFVSAGGGVYTFTGTPTDATTALRALVFNPTDNRVTPGSTESTSFTISADDGVAAPTTDSDSTVYSVSVNDAPTIGGITSPLAVADAGTVRPFANVTIGDVDSPAQTLAVSVTLDSAAKGVFTPASLTASGFASAGGGVYTFSGTAAAAQTAIRQLSYDPTNNRVAPGSTEITTFTISVDDSIASAVTNSGTSVYSVSINDAPTIGSASAGQAVNDNATVTLFSAVTIGDVDSPAQTQTVSVSLDSAAKGVFTNASLSASGFVSAGGGVYTFSGTAAQAQTAIRQLVFDPTDNRVTPGSTETTTFTITVNDGLATPQSNSTTTVVSTSVNDAPTIGGVSAGQAVNETSTITPFSSATIADVDSPAQTQTVSVTLDTAAKGVFTSASLAASGFVSAGGGVYTFSGTAAAAQAAIRQLAFDPTDDRVNTGSTETTTFTISVDDGVAAAVTNSTTTVVSTAVNVAPTIGGVSAGQAVNDNATVSPFSAVTIADPDTAAQTQTVSVTLDTAAKGVFTNASLTASGFVSAGGGVYTFSGTAAQTQTAIRQLVFDPTDNRVTPGSTETTTFTISVDDGVAAASTNNTTTVVSTSANDAPTIGGASAGQAVNENATVTPFSTVTFADVDSPAQTQTVSVTLDTAAKGIFTSASLSASGFVDAGSGVYTFSGTAAQAQTAIRQLVFNPTDNRVNTGSTETTTFTISIDDGVASAVTDNTTTVVSTAVNDAPTIGGVTAGQTTNDNANVSPFSAVTIVDGDTPAQTLSVSVTLDTAAKGVFTPASLTASGFVSAGGGAYTFSGDAAAAQAAIRQLVFNPTNDRVAPGSTETTTFTISVDDGVASAATDNTTTVISTSVNDAPVIGSTSAGQAVNDNATVTLFSAVTIADSDSPAQTQTVSVTLDTAAKGVFTSASLSASGFVDAGGGVYTFSGTAAAAQTAIRQLVFDPTNNRVTPGSTETTTFTISVDDGQASAMTDNTTTVVSTSVNDAPTIGGVSAGQAVNDNATVSPFSAVTIADVDSPAQTQTVSVTLDTAAKGVFTSASLTASGFVSAGGGVYTFSGTAAAAQAAIRQLVFDPTNDRVAPASTETTTFTISVNDGVAAAVTDNTTTVVSTSVNDAPTIGGVSAGQGTNDTATVLPFSAVTIADPDSPAQTLSVSVTLDTAAKGAFTSASLTASGFVSAGGGVYTFSGTASAAQTAIRQLVFDPTNDRVAPGFTETTTFTISVDDSVASAQTDNTTTVVSTSVNDAPTIGGASAGQAVNDNANVSPFSAITIADPDTPAQTQTVSVTLDSSAKGVFTPASLSASGFVDAGSGVYTFTGTAAQAQTAIRQLVYNPTDNRVTPGSTETTTFTISVADGLSSPQTNSTTTVVSTSVNDAPTIGGVTAGQAVNETSTVSPFSSTTIADQDFPAQTLSVSVSLDTAAKGVFTPASLTASGFVSAGGGVYTFSGTAAAAQTAIRQLVFNPTDNRVNTGSTETTTFTISVDDGVAAAVTNSTTTVVSTAVNEAPTVGGTSAGQTVNDNATVTPFSAVTFADVDAPTQTQTVSVTLDTAAKGVFTSASLTSSGFVDAGGGVYTFSGTAAQSQVAIRQLAFDPTDNRVNPGSTETTTFTISISDGVASAVLDAITTVIATSVNDAPTIGGASAGQTTNDEANVSPFTSVTIADADSAQTVSVSVALDTAAKGVFTPASLSASGFVSAGGGVYTFSGTAAQAQTAIRQLVFNPTDDRVAIGSTETTTFTISVDDGVAVAVTDNTTTVISTSVNDAPVIGGAAAGQTVNDDATVSPFTSVTISDTDLAAQTLSIAVTIDSSAKGVFTSASLTASGFVDAGSGVYTFSGTAAQSQTAIRQLVFDPTDNRVAPGSTETATFTIVAFDGQAAPATNTTTTVISTSMNDAPVFGGASAGQTVNDDANVTPFSSVTISDPDSPAQTQTVTVTLDSSAKGVFTPASLTASGFLSAGGGVYTFTGTAAASQTAIRQLVFAPTANRVAPSSTETTSFSITVNDGATTTSDSTTTVISTSVNDAPTISGTAAGQGVNENGTITPFTSVTIADVDSPAQTLTVTVTLSAANHGEFTAGSRGSSGFVDAGGGVYTFSGTAAQATTAIRALAFDPTDNRVNTGSTESTIFEITVNDGIASDVTDSTTTVVSTAVNDAPVIGGTSSAQPVNDNATLLPFQFVTITDNDSPAQTQTVVVAIDNAAKGVFTPSSLTASGFISSGTGVYQFTGTASAAQAAIRQLVFNPTDDRVAVNTTESSTFLITVLDGVASPVIDSNTTVESTSMNDAPTLGGAVAGQTTNDIANISPFASFTIADADPGQLQLVTITLDNTAKGAFTPASLTASGFVLVVNGSYEFTGTAAAAQTAIRQLVFNPTDYRVAVGATEVTTFTVTTADGIVPAVSNLTTTVISTSTNVAPTINVTSSLGTAATARAAYTITYAQLLSASSAADQNVGDSISFRIESVASGTLTKNGVAVTAGSTTISSGESLVWRSAAGASGVTSAFTIKATDGTALSSASTVRVNVNAAPAATAANNANVSIASTSAGLVSVLTHNDAGQTILLQQSTPNGSWTRINLDAVAGLGTVTGDAQVFVDPINGQTYAAVITSNGLVLLRNSGSGWVARNLTTEINGAPSIASKLNTFATIDGKQVITGVNGSGDLVVYYETGATNNTGQPVWTAVNLYTLLRNQSESTPVFTSPLTTYVTSWNGLNIAGLDASGNIWSVWTGGGLTGWHSTNISLITNAPALSGGVTAYTTSWGGINLAGIDSNGALSVTWWVPSFGGSWVNTNFTQSFGGPALQAGSITSYVTGWNALNVAGLDSTGNIVQYWWVPPTNPSQDTWHVTPLTSSMNGGLPRFNGRLAGLSTGDSRLNLVGQAQDGRILRVWWSPSHDWSLEDLTSLV